MYSVYISNIVLFDLYYFLWQLILIMIFVRLFYWTPHIFFTFGDRELMFCTVSAELEDLFWPVLNALAESSCPLLHLSLGETRTQPRLLLNQICSVVIILFSSHTRYISTTQLIKNALLHFMFSYVRMIKTMKWLKWNMNFLQFELCSDSAAQIF